MNIKEHYSRATATMKTSMIREMLAQTKGVAGMVSFAGGFPSPQTFPAETLASLFAEATTEAPADVLQYGASEGDIALKETIIKMIEERPQTADRRQQNTTPCPLNRRAITNDEILICNGATNGIYYFTRALVNEGDVILCEAPTFLGSVVSFEACGAEVVAIDMDNDGIRLDLLSEQIKTLRSKGKTIKLLYTIPDFQNPTGITMSLQRRHDLIKLMQTEGILILEDDPYRELRYTGEMLPSLYEIARYEYGDAMLVTVIKSFSKILGPGLRMAYAIGHPDIIRPMCSWLQKIIVNPDGVTQRAVAKYINAGYLTNHITSIREFYRPFQTAIIDALEKFMPPEVTFTKPDGGIFVWLSVSALTTQAGGGRGENLDFDTLFSEIVSQKVCYIPGSKFYPAGYEKHNCLRLNFSYPTIEQIYNGVEILAKVIKSKL